MVTFKCHLKSHFFIRILAAVVIFFTLTQSFTYQTNSGTMILQNTDRLLQHTF